MILSLLINRYESSSFLLIVTQNTFLHTRVDYTRNLNFLPNYVLLCRAIAKPKSRVVNRLDRFIHASVFFFHVRHFLSLGKFLFYIATGTFFRMVTGILGLHGQVAAFANL